MIYDKNTTIKASNVQYR